MTYHTQVADLVSEIISLGDFNFYYTYQLWDKNTAELECAKTGIILHLDNEYASCVFLESIEVPSDFKLFGMPWSSKKIKLPRATDISSTVSKEYLIRVTKPTEDQVKIRRNQETADSKAIREIRQLVEKLRGSK